MPFYHEQIAQLAHELRLSPARHRLRQVGGIIRAIDLIDPEREYPYAFVCFTITGYRPRRMGDTLFSGKELIADLVELLDAFTATHPLPALALDSHLYEADALARRLGVSTKTISRWRKRGLAGCWYVSDSEKPRFAFSSRAIERFVARHRELVHRGATFQLMGAEEKARIIARARELVATRKCSLHLITQELAGETGRAVETIRYTLRRFDREHPDLALFDRAEQPHPIDEDTVIYDAYVAGDTATALAERFGKKPSQIARILTRVRAAALAQGPIECVYNPIFDAPDAEHQILRESAPRAHDEQAHAATLSGVPSNLPPYLQDLYRTPLLTKTEEADLFRRMNFLRHQALVTRSRFVDNPAAACPADIAAIEANLDAARAIKNQIIQANLRLVVSIAKRHLRSHARADLFELVSDGNISLMKSVEKFDYAKGFAFSTYASWAIMRGFARTVPDELVHCDRYQTGHEEFLSAARDHHPIELPADDEQGTIRAALSNGLEMLDDRERAVVRRHFGVGQSSPPATLDEIGRELGLSKERVRQIELRALSKLRVTLADSPAAALAG